MDLSVFFSTLGGSALAISVGAAVIYVARERVTEMFLSTSRFKSFAREHRYRLFHERRVNALAEIHAGFFKLGSAASSHIVNRAYESQQSSQSLYEVVGLQNQLSEIVGINSIFLDKDLEVKINNSIHAIGRNCHKFQGEMQQEKSLGYWPNKEEDFPSFIKRVLNAIGTDAEDAKNSLRDAVKKLDDGW